MAPGLKNWGVPFAPTIGRAWPVLPQGGPANRAVPYTRSDDTVAGNAATRFHADRQDNVRYHAGVDLVCSPGDAVLAIAPGTVLGQIPGFVRLGAVVVDHGAVVCVYAEIALDSLAAVGLKTGSKVIAGQRIGTGALNDSGRSMLHFETWAPGHAPAAYTPWYVGSPPPVGLLDPTALLLALAVGKRPAPRASGGPAWGFWLGVGAFAAGIGVALGGRK